MKSSVEPGEMRLRYWSKFTLCLAVLVLAMNVFGVLFFQFALSVPKTANRCRGCDADVEDVAVNGVSALELPTRKFAR